MIDLVCECDDALGLPHSHLYENVRVTLPPGGSALRREGTGWVSLSVDWRAVARGRVALALSRAWQTLLLNEWASP